MDIFFSILKEAWILTLEMAPYLLIGFFAAGILHVFIPLEIFSRHLGRENASSVVKASLFGIPIPLCSCGVLPVAAGLRRSGAGRSSTLSFLITTPVTGVDSIMATWALFGWIFTIARVLASVVIGFFSGLLMILFSRSENSQTGEIDNSGDACKDTFCTDNACGVQTSMDTAISARNESFTRRVKEVFHYAFIELPASFSGSLLFGLILAGIIAYFLPPELINQYFGSNIVGIIVAILIAIPLYVCATGSIPIAAAMIASGFTPGAALSFLIAGPATNTVAVLTVKKILGNRATVIYLVSIFLGAIGFGVLLDQFNFNWKAIETIDHAHHETSIIKLLSAIILMTIIGILFMKEKYMKYFKKTQAAVTGYDNAIVLSSPDISCMHCARTIKETLSGLEEIREVAVDVNTKTIRVEPQEGASPDLDKILLALKEAGYPSKIKE